MTDLPTMGEGFAGMLLRLRGRTGLSQRDVADRIGVHVRSVQLWEAGETHPNARRLQALIGVLLEAGAFTPGSEDLEAVALWNAADVESDRLRAPFDERWFATLLAGRSSPPATPTAALPPRHVYAWGGAPDLAGFLGRERERDTVRQWLQDERTRVVAVVGMGGMGKTMLGTRVAADLAPAFERVCWRSLRDAPPFDEWLVETLRLLSPDRPRHGETSGLGRLLEIARATPCLLVLDNYESVLEPGTHAGRYRPGYEWYGALLDEFARGSHPSRLLLTSREQPPEIVPLRGRSANVLVVGGLPVADSRALLVDQDLEGDRAAWEAFVQRYAGNPLALKLAGASIGELFGGDITAYLDDLDLGPGAVFGGVRKLLDSQLQRLSALEEDVLRWLAVEREPTTFADLAASLAARFPRRDIREAAEALLRRSLLERSEPPGGPVFALHPVVLEYVSERLVEEVADEIAAGQVLALCARPLMKAVSKEYVRASQERVLVEPVLAWLEARLGSRSAVERQLLGLLDVLRDVPLDEHGYAPGTITNLLRLLRGDLSGLDLSGLAIRQACLRDVDALDANLAGVQLREATLPEPFDFTAGVAFSADGDYLAVGSTQGDVCIWRVADWVLQAVASGHRQACWAVAMSADGRRLASGGLDGTVRVWDATTGACLAIGPGHRGGVRAVASSGDGRVLASGGEDGTLRLWDGATAAPLTIINAHPGGVWSLAASGDGRLFASCGVDGTVRLWDGREGACLATLAAHGGRLYGVTLTRSGEFVISAGVDGAVQVWDASDGTLRGALLGHSGVIQAVASNRDGRLVASVGADGVLGLWDATTMTPLAAWHPHLGGVRGVAVSESGHLVASVGDDGTLRVWQAATRELLAILRGHAGWHRDVALSPDGRYLVGAGNDGRVHIWDTRSDAGVVTLRGHAGGVWAVGLSADGRLLATGGDDGTVRLWEVLSGATRAVLRGHQGGVWRVTMAGDGHLVASSGLDGSVRLWTGDGSAVAVLHGHRGGVRALAMSADGLVLVSGGLDGVVKLWQPTTEAQPGVLVGHTGLVRAVAASADGSVVASGGADGTVRVWVPPTGPPVTTLEGLVGIRTVALSHDGALLATGGDDGALRLWSARSGTPLGAVTGHVGGVWGVALSADGRLLASGGSDGVARLWGGPAPSLQAEFRADRPYERMDITGLSGVTSAQRVALIALGATDRSLQARPDRPDVDLPLPSAADHPLKLLRPPRRARPRSTSA